MCVRGPRSRHSGRRVSRFPSPRDSHCVPGVKEEPDSYDSVEFLGVSVEKETSLSRDPWC